MTTTLNPRKRIPSSVMTAVITAGILAFGPGVSTAESGRSMVRSQTHTEYADVVDVRPIYSTIDVERPERECWIEHPSHNTVYEGYKNQRGRQRSSSSRANPVVGGFIGGAIGNQIGRATGDRGARIGATIVGAMVGSVIANESQVRDRRERISRRDRRSRPNVPLPQERHQNSSASIERCATRIVTHVERQKTGYDVTYRYLGRNYHIQTRRHPGRQIALEVSIRPKNH